MPRMVYKTLHKPLTGAISKMETNVRAGLLKRALGEDSEQRAPILVIKLT